MGYNSLLHGKGAILAALPPAGSKPISFRPETAFFRNVCVNLRDCLCDGLNVRLRTIP